MIDTFVGILLFLEGLFYSLLQFSEQVLNVMGTRVSDLILPGNPYYVIIKNSPFWNMSFVSLMLSAGITIYFTYQFLTWLLNVVT